MSKTFSSLATEQTYETGYEDCMKEWLGFLRVKYENMKLAQANFNPHSAEWAGAYHYMECLKALINERWHVDVEVEDIVDGK